MDEYKILEQKIEDAKKLALDRFQELETIIMDEKLWELCAHFECKIIDGDHDGDGEKILAEGHKTYKPNDYYLRLTFLKYKNGDIRLGEFDLEHKKDMSPKYAHVYIYPNQKGEYEIKYFKHYDSWKEPIIKWIKSLRGEIADDRHKQKINELNAILALYS